MCFIFKVSTVYFFVIIDKKHRTIAWTEGYFHIETGRQKLFLFFMQETEKFKKNSEKAVLCLCVCHENNMFNTKHLNTSRYLLVTLIVF